MMFDPSPQVQIRAEGDDPLHPRYPVGEVGRQQAAPAISDKYEPTVSRSDLQKSALEALNDPLGVPVQGPDQGLATRVLHRQTEAAGPCEVDSTGILRCEQVEGDRILWRGIVRHPPSIDPRIAIAIDKHENTGARARRAAALRENKMDERI